MSWTLEGVLGQKKRRGGEKHALNANLGHSSKGISQFKRAHGSHAMGNGRILVGRSFICACMGVFKVLEMIKGLLHRSKQSLVLSTTQRPTKGIALGRHA
jgi:hypothetical protein